MESKGVNGILFESNAPGKRFEIFYENGILNVHLRDGSQEEPVYNNQVSLPSSKGEITTGKVIVTFDNQAKNIKIEHNNKPVMQIYLPSVGNFPNGLFPDGQIAEIRGSNGAKSSVKLTELEILVPSLDSSLASIGTPAAIPTLPLPVGQLVPVPSSDQKITAENVKDLQEIARYYGQIDYAVKLTKDRQFLFILDPDGVTKYNLETMEPIVHIQLAKPDLRRISDLQMSDDGNWLLIDNNWLVDLRDDDEPAIHVLSEKIRLLNLYSKDFRLSADGSMIAAEQHRCYAGCDYKLQIISTEDFEVLHVSTGANLQAFPTFSPDGAFLALVDTFFETDREGNSTRVGASIRLRNTSEFNTIENFPIMPPFEITGIAFSEDNHLIAVAQTTRVDVFNITTGKSEFTLPDLCYDSYWNRKVLFTPSSPLSILVSSRCGSGIWTITPGDSTYTDLANPLELSKISFDSNGNPTIIPYPYPLTDLKDYRRQYYFQFLSTDILALKNLDTDLYARRSCEISLSKGTLNCQARLGKEILLGTDGQYYSTDENSAGIDIYSLTDQSQLYYSIPSVPGRGRNIELIALDSANNLLFYWVNINNDLQQILIKDIESGDTIAKWEGQIYLSSIAFSEDKKIAALCQNIGMKNDRGKLVIFDLVQRKTVFSMDVTCGGSPMALTQDGSKLAIEHYYLSEPAKALWSIRTMILDTSGSFKKLVDIESSSRAVAFSPDDLLLAIACGEREICFLDPSSGEEIYRLQAHSNLTKLAFSKDGSLLAAISQWGLISIWAVPPLQPKSRDGEAKTTSNLPVCLPGDQIIDFDSTYEFQINPIEGADYYYWEFYQNGSMVWERPWDGSGAGRNIYKIPSDSIAHIHFAPGPLEIWVSPLFESIRTIGAPVFISACLVKR